MLGATSVDFCAASADWACPAPQPTAHRVINADPSRSRVSLPFFYEPAFEAVVAPLPQLAGASPGGAARGLKPVRYGRHLESKVLSNFELEPDVAAAV